MIKRKKPLLKNIAVDSLHPIVQRLVVDFPWLKNYVIYTPPVLVGSLNHDYNILQENEKLVRSGKHSGHTREGNAYKKILPSFLTPVQLEWSVGCVLSDATLQLNNNARACRIKMQQVDYHYPFLAVTRAILAPWFFGPIPPPKKNKSGSFMQEIQTIKHGAFMDLVELFQNPTIPLYANSCVKKYICPKIEKYLTPVCLAAWFIGDGGRQDYSKQYGGKGIQFHTQGFSKQDVDMLVFLLRRKYGWDFSSAFDGKNKKGEDMYVLNLHSSYFESFVHYVGPYIPEHFFYKLPTPRSPKSRFANPVYPIPRIPRKK